MNATMRDERLHPVSRQIAKVHVLEEARHVSFAKTYLAKAWLQLEADERSSIAEMAASMVAVVADLSVDPTSGQITLRAEVPNPRGFLLPGMYVRVRLEQAQTPTGIVVPQQAVQRGSTGDRSSRMSWVFCTHFL